MPGNKLAERLGVADGRKWSADVSPLVLVMLVQRPVWIAVQILQAAAAIFIIRTTVRIGTSVATSDSSVAHRLLVWALAIDAIATLAAFQWLVLLKYRSWETGESESSVIGTWRRRVAFGWMIAAGLLVLILATDRFSSIQ